MEYRNHSSSREQKVSCKDVFLLYKQTLFLVEESLKESSLKKHFHSLFYIYTDDEEREKLWQLKQLIRDVLSDEMYYFSMEYEGLENVTKLQTNLQLLRNQNCIYEEEFIFFLSQLIDRFESYKNAYTKNVTVTESYQLRKHMSDQKIIQFTNAVTKYMYEVIHHHFMKSNNTEQHIIMKYFSFS